MRIYCETCKKEYQKWTEFYNEHYLDESDGGDYEFHLRGSYLPIHKIENEQEWNKQFAENMFGAKDK